MYGVFPKTIKNVLLGWVPAPASTLAELDVRRTQREERGIQSLPAKRKPSQQRRAHDAVHYAVAVGYLRKEPCHCGNRIVQAHHHLGYADEHFLDVVWLCARHHKEAHPNRAIPRNRHSSTP